MIIITASVIRGDICSGTVVEDAEIMVAFRGCSKWTIFLRFYLPRRGRLAAGHFMMIMVMAMHIFDQIICSEEIAETDNTFGELFLLEVIVVELSQWPLLGVILVANLGIVDDLCQATSGASHPLHGHIDGSRCIIIFLL